MTSEGGLTGFSNSAIDSHDSNDDTSQRSAAKDEYQQARPSRLEEQRDAQNSDANNADYGPNDRSAVFQKTGHSANADYGRENSERSENQVPESGYDEGNRSTTFGRDNTESKLGGESASGSSDDTASSMASNMYGGSGTDDSGTNSGPGSDPYNSTKEGGYNDGREIPGKEYEGSGDNYGSSGGY